MNTRRDIYAEVTDRIISKLESGTIPWRKPWNAAPANYVSKKPYRGVNVWLLDSDYRSPYWLTFRQAKKLGGYIRKGEKGTQIVFWKILEEKLTDVETGEIKARRFPILKYYTVFNLEQCEGIDMEIAPVVEPIASAEEIIANYQNPPALMFGGNRASYNPAQDTVHMPVRETFKSPAEYYSTLFHEYIHSAGHSSRLNRESIKDVRFGSDTYSEEELVAEMGAAYLCGMSGTDLVAKTLENSAAYINHWRSKLSKDKRLIVRASCQAQKAADWIIGRRDGDAS